ncbi:peptidoglycan editing factor PgeF [Glaciecola sp. 1036]|uniref:peptidoglycan editing factor PgeF n=1 Tax=Alteromonadaceae TaxID=72275 RepID=UPI003CFF4B21
MKTISPTYLLAPNVVCFSCTREQGESLVPYDSLNMGLHVGDNRDAVLQNRGYLFEYCQQLTGNTCNFPVFMNQQHSNQIIDVDKNTMEPSTIADGIFTSQKHLPLCVMTADCLPIVMTDGIEVAAVHAGWRGLAEGIVEKAVANFADPTRLAVWIGPSISQEKFEVGLDVIKYFTQYSSCIRPSSLNNKYLLDLPAICQQILNNAGVENIQLSNICSYRDERFFSHRQATHSDIQQTGRNVTVIIKT